MSPVRFDLDALSRLALGAPAPGTRWRAVPHHTGVGWRVVARVGNGDVAVAGGMSREGASWLASVPALAHDALDALEELLVARDLLRAWLRTADPLMAHQADHLLAATDGDWRIDVADEAARWLWEGAPE